MKEEQINIAIAEACGWKKLTVPLEDDLGPIGDMTTTKWKRPSNPYGYVDPTSSVPNYCNDLNAMREAIMSLPSGVRDNSFTSQLAMVCGFKAHGSDAWSELHQGRCAVINATARQRAEAFLRTLGKWEEPS